MLSNQPLNQPLNKSLNSDATGHQDMRTKPTSKPVRLLVVEDEYILATNLQECLESLGYTVVAVVNNAAMAIAKAAELQPDLVLMDIRLQGEMDGIQAATEIWHHYEIPIIYVTGHSDKSTVERATLAFPFGYILKPVKEKELYVAIQTALNRYEREQFLSMVLRGMGDGVVVTDMHLQIKYLNGAAEKLSGWSLKEALNRPITEVVYLIDELTQQPIIHPAVIAMESNQCVYVNHHTLLVTKNQTQIPIADSAAPLRDQQGTMVGVVLVFRDDTQQRLIAAHEYALLRAQQMELQLQELQRLNHLKDDFLATTSHELRTPLSNIKLAVCMLETVLNQQSLLKEDESSKAPMLIHYLGVLREQCDQELKLINDLLDMRSLEANAYPLDPQSLHLQDWLPHIADSFQDRADTQQQTLVVEVAPDLPEMVTDLFGLTRIVSELLNNACKYTPPQERIEMLARLGDRGDTPHVVILIRNSGTEIPADQLARIFDPFYRIPSNDPWKHGGTGLGLALVKRLVHYMQGAIEATSQDGWTTFSLELPLALDLEKSDPDPL